MDELDDEWKKFDQSLLMDLTGKLNQMTQKR